MRLVPLPPIFASRTRNTESLRCLVGGEPDSSQGATWCLICENAPSCSTPGVLLCWHRPFKRHVATALFAGLFVLCGLNCFDTQIAGHQVSYLGEFPSFSPVVIMFSRTL
jgi:hypothetical protein